MVVPAAGWHGVDEVKEMMDNRALGRNICGRGQASNKYRPAGVVEQEAPIVVALSAEALAVQRARALVMCMMQAYVGPGYVTRFGQKHALLTRSSDDCVCV